MTGVAELIAEASTNPPRPIIEGLLNESEIAGLHGAPEVFKTIFCLQLATSLATGRPLFDVWKVPAAQTVYFFETEMSVGTLAGRLAKMFAERTPPQGIHFADESRLRTFRRAPTLSAKFSLLRDWVDEARADVLILDTANPFFRGKESPNDETVAGAFFDLLEAMPAPAKLFVRHNHKPRIDDPGDAAAKIRGSGQFSDVPDLLLELQRRDKRTNEAVLGVSKFRHGTKPDDVSLWLDSRDLQLITVPPVIYLLGSGPRSRPELLEGLETRFGIKQRRADELINEQRAYLAQRTIGHTRLFEIDWESASQADWLPRIGDSGEMVGDTQPCTSSSFSLGHQPPASLGVEVAER